MGAPYSKEVKAITDTVVNTHDEITPLVKAVLPLTTAVLEKLNYAIILIVALLALLIILLFFLLLAVFALILVTHPDLTKQRDALITPTLQTLCRWMGA